MYFLSSGLLIHSLPALLNPWHYLSPHTFQHLFLPANWLNSMTAPLRKAEPFAKVEGETWQFFHRHQSILQNQFRGRFCLNQTVNPTHNGLQWALLLLCKEETGQFLACARLLGDAGWQVSSQLSRATNLFSLAIQLIGSPLSFVNAKKQSTYSYGSNPFQTGEGEEEEGRSS